MVYCKWLRLRSQHHCVLKWFIYAILFVAFVYLVSSYSECQRKNRLQSIIPKYISSLVYVKSYEANIIDDEWKPIGNPSLRFKIYSAYFETRAEVLKQWKYEKDYLPYGAVRVIAILPFRIRFDVIKCFMLNSDGTNITVIANHVKAINEHFNMKFSAFMVVCALTNSVQNPFAYLPHSVSLIYETEASMQQPTSFVDIRYPSNVHTKSLAICVGPFQNEYNEALRLVEFVEIYKLLGAEHFYFYNKSTTWAVNKVVQHYQEQKIASVQKWNFYGEFYLCEIAVQTADGYAFEKDVRYEGIFAAINDCLYRADYDGFNYIAIVDVDEILMPLKNQSLIELILENDEFKINSFNFRGVMFHSNHANDTSTVPYYQKNEFLYSQIKTQRLMKSAGYHERSKYIAKIRRVVELGNHFVHNDGMIEGGKEYEVPIYQGLLFHYRTDCIPHFTCEKPTKNDTTARRYQNHIWEAVDDVCATIFDDAVCPLS